MRAAAKTFIAAGNPSRALEAISTIQENAKEHWILYQQGKAELAISLPESVTTATRALALAIKDPRALKRLSSYYELLSDCQENCGDVQGALASIEDAINCTDNPKYRNSLMGTSKNIHLQKLSGHEKAAVGRPCNSIPYDDYSNTSLGS
jgi:hypothetical protein